MWFNRDETVSRLQEISRRISFGRGARGPYIFFVFLLQPSDPRQPSTPISGWTPYLVFHLPRGPAVRTHGQVEARGMESVRNVGKSAGRNFTSKKPQAGNKRLKAVYNVDAVRQNSRKRRNMCSR